MGDYKRYRKFEGKEQGEEPRVREFREFGTTSLQGITVTNFMYSGVQLSFYTFFISPIEIG